MTTHTFAAILALTLAVVPAAHADTHPGAAADQAPYTYSESYGQPFTTRLTATFPDSSIKFTPTTDELAHLADVHNAAMVTINGRTSTYKWSKADERLALARAVSAREWLVDHGVSPLKIMVNYASAVDYAVDNSTPEGRRQNQRVDIEVFYVPMK